MPSVYLIDAHNPVLGTSKINDTVSVPFGTARSVRGSFPVTVPFDVPIDGTPTDLDDLITKKYSAILSLYPGYTNILYDELVDANGWASVNGLRGITVGERQTTSMLKNQVLPLSNAAVTLAYSPPVVIFRWEAFEYVNTDTTGETYTRAYKELSPSAFVVSVGFGGPQMAVTSGVPLSIPLANQGTDFEVYFTRTGITTPTKAFLGSWALIY